MKVRKLKRHDLHNGFLDLLGTRYTLGTLPFGKQLIRFLQIDSNPNHLIYIVVEKQKILGTATLLIFENFFSGYKTGKIFDVIISQEENCVKEIEKILIKTLTNIAKKQNCYKITLENVLMIPDYKSLGLIPSHYQEIRHDDEFF